MTQTKLSLASISSSSPVSLSLLACLPVTGIRGEERLRTKIDEYHVGFKRQADYAMRLSAHVSPNIADDIRDSIWSKP